MFRLICLFIGYFIGCLQFAFLISKIVAKIDIREHGSGNSGATNVTRVLGAKIGITVFIFDILKGVLGFLICSIIFKGTGTFYTASGSELGILPGLYGGIGVILGHNFPFFLKFKGGKGSASGLGVILSTDLKTSLLTFLAGFIIAVLTRYISLASLVIWFTFTVLLFVFAFPTESVWLSLFLFLLSLYQHRSNIDRLINKTENKFTFKPKNTKAK